MGFVNEELENFKRQTIDRERNIVLIQTLNGIEGPSEFTLTFKDFETKLWASRIVTGYKRKNDFIKWRVEKVHIPHKFEKQRSYVLKTIEEALDGFGFAASRDLVNKLEVTFSPQIKGI